MRKKLYASLTVIAIFCYSLTIAQTRTISGRVTSADTKETVSSVSVIVKGTADGTFTDEKGNFKITTKQSLPVVLVFSSIGFEEQTVNVNAAEEIVITMTPASSLGQEVVLAATRMPTRLLESPVSIERVNARQILNSPATSYYDMAGMLKGVDLTTSSLTFKTIGTILKRGI